MVQNIKRQADGDFLRIIASFFVVLIHVIGERIGPAPFSGSLIFPALLNAICHISIPIFIMLSGRFMLSRPISVPKALKKAGNTFLQLLFWGLFYFLADIFIFNRSASGLWASIVTILTKPLHLWYFYAAIALYLLTPFCAVFVQNANKKEALYALFFTFLFGSLLHILCESEFAGIVPLLLNKMKLSTSFGFLFCFLLGDYIYRYGVYKRACKIIYIAGFLCILFMTTITLYYAAKNGGAPDYTLYSFVSPTILIPALGTVLFAKNYFERHTKGNYAWIHLIAAQTPGIYGIHILLIWLIPKSFLQNFSPFWQCISIGTLSYILSFAIIFYIKKLFERIR